LIAWIWGQRLKKERCGRFFRVFLTGYKSRRTDAKGAHSGLSRSSSPGIGRRVPCLCISMWSFECVFSGVYKEAPLARSFLPADRLYYSLARRTLTQGVKAVSISSWAFLWGRNQSGIPPGPAKKRPPLASGNPRRALARLKPVGGFKWRVFV